VSLVLIVIELSILPLPFLTVQSRVLEVNDALTPLIFKVAVLVVPKLLALVNLTLKLDVDVPF
jgi:hypothetical protein